MSAIPAFEIGVWNAWIFIVYYILGLPFTILINKGAVEKSDSATPAYQGKEDKIVEFYQLSYFSSPHIFCFSTTEIRYDMVLYRPTYFFISTDYAYYRYD